jgi:hypothetical protein
MLLPGCRYKRFVREMFSGKILPESRQRKHRGQEVKIEEL